MVESSRFVEPWRAAVAWQARAAAGRAGWSPPAVARVSLVFHMPTPKAMQVRVDRLPPGRLMPHAKRPDVDKLARSTLDALVTAGVLADDSHVAELTARKFYARTGGAGVFVSVEEHP